MKPKIDAATAAEKYDSGLTLVQIAQEFDATEASVRRALLRAEQEGWVRPRLRPLSEVVLEKPLVHTLTEGSLAITADYHFPLTNYELLNRFLDDAAKLDVRALAVAGDWWNQDSLSRFDSKQDSAGLAEELEAGNLAMRRVLELFDTVYFTWGNHDARVHKTMGYKVPFATAMRMMFYDVPDKMLAKVQFSNLDHMIVQAFEYADRGQDTWYVCHPKTYSRRPLVTAMELSAIRGENIMCAHSHHHAYGWDRSGRYRLVEVGGFFDGSKVEYLQRTDVYPTWTNGYSFLDENNQLFLRGSGVALAP